MKKLIIGLFCIITTGVFAQAPQYLNYQGIARDASGNILTNPIGLKFEVLQGSASGTVVYDEINTINPSSAGIFTAAIGSGAPGTGTFSAINWASGLYFLRVNIDPAGGTSYSTVGTSQLLSVPYALYAETSGNAATTYSAGTGISISSGSIINTAPDKTVTIVGLGSTTVSGVYPNFTISTPTNASAASISTIQINPPHTITNLGPNNNSITIQPTAITAAGIASVSGTYPNFNVGVPGPSLSITGNTISISQGTVVSTKTLATTTGTGTAGFISKWNTTNDLNNSGLFQDAAGKIGFNIVTPRTMFHLFKAAGSDTLLIESPNASSTGLSLKNINGNLSIVNNGGQLNFFDNAVAMMKLVPGLGLAINKGLPAYRLDVGGNMNLDNEFNMLAMSTPPPPAPSNQGRIFFSGSTNGFMVSENGSPYQPLFPPPLWAASSSTAVVLANPTNSVGIGTNSPVNKLEVVGTTRFGDNVTTSGYISTIQNSIPSGISGGVLTLFNTGVRSIGHDAVSIQNLTTKVGGSGSTKTGLTIQSTGSWAPSTGQTNVGLSVNVSGADNNYAATFTGGSVGIGTGTPVAPLDVVGEIQTDSIMISGPGIPNIGAVLVSRDATGNAKWAPNIGFKGQFAPSTPVTISTTTLNNIGNTLGGYTSSTVYNNGGGFSFSGSGARYQVPETGIYFLEACIMVGVNPSATGNNYVALELFNSTTATVLERVMQSNPDTNNTLNTVLHCSTPYPLTKNDIIVLRLTGSTATAGTISNSFPQTDKMNTFSGFLIR